MTLIELEAQKALLIREILTDVNSEEMMHKLRDFFYKLKSETASYTMPPDLLKDLMLQAEKDDAAGFCITSEELDKEMETW
jgi:hypothetical protein